MQIVVGHANPDFDAYAATVAATKLFPGAKGAFLGSQNANVRAFHNLHEDFLDFVDLRDVDLSDVDQLVLVDTHDADRIGEFGEVARRPDTEIIVYDHHPAAEGDLVDVDDRSVETGAATSILVHEIAQRGIELTPLEASLLLLGIHEDTGSLTYPSATAYDAEAAAFLMAHDADIEVLNRFLTRTLDSQQRELLDQLQQSLEIWDINGQDVAVGTAVATEYVDSASVLTHYIVEDMGFRVAIALVEMPGRVQVVARSRSAEVDVGAVMSHVGGGGHPQAASAAFKDLPLAEARERVRSVLESAVHAPLVARDIMTAPVHTISPEAAMSDARDLMSRWGHGGLPVVDHGGLLGMITRKDVDKAERHGLSHAPVKGFMTRDVVTVPVDQDLAGLERILATRGIGRTPVIDAGDMVGITTRKDLLRAEHGDSYLDRRVPRVRSAATARFLESFETLVPKDLREPVLAIGRLAEERGMRAHLVGGIVRDMLLSVANTDIDIVVEGDAVEFAEEVAEALGVRAKVHRRFGTAVLVVDDSLHIDLTSARTEYYARPGALPTVERSSLRQDLFRRDFTINAMAACINPECLGSIADSFGGLADLENETVRVLHALSFVEDPTRVLRAARFEKRYGFAMNATTADLAGRAVSLHMLDEVSGARLREEVLDILAEPDPAPILSRLQELGALEGLLPEGVRATNVPALVAETDRAISELAERLPRRTSRDVALAAALSAGAQREAADRWLRHVRLSRAFGTPVLELATRGESALRSLRDRRRMRDSRLYRLLEPFSPESILVLWARGGDRERKRIDRYLGELVPIRPAVSGTDLIALGYEPSAAFSDILARARDARLDGKAVGREAELANLKRLAARHPASRKEPA